MTRRGAGAIAVIAGTGVAEHMTPGASRSFRTKFGEATVCEAMGGRVLLLQRHGPGHTVAPHRVNYRANIAALKEAGVDRVIATSAVGSMNPRFRPGQVGLAAQFLDFTKGRPATMLDDDVVNTDMTDPYSEAIGGIVATAGRSLGVDVRKGLVYVCTEGPRFETAAEIRMFRKMGGDVIGMTGVPEVVFAREAGMEYASVLIATNWAAGMQERVSHEEVLGVMKRIGKEVKGIIGAAVELMEGRLT